LDFFLSLLFLGRFIVNSSHNDSRDCSVEGCS